ncbi:RagB/SusD family nutrient uptake outer membrane protein [Pedobacter gandavensis]|uniref:RagB/SusD family nutrient uptake outer membrane protein n=1 Tax=Pedobacter gandavensis TaxID=2679963 RepID=UPI002930ED84|nr:RagB/SusD family nutrient uptake outer membrane protein [Pedobacter gandavensis]
MKSKIVNFTGTLLIAVFLFLLGSCKKFLSELPSKSSNIPVSTIGDLDAILANYSSFYTEENNMAIMATDNTGFNKNIFDVKPSVFPNVWYFYSFFGDPDLIANNTLDRLWSGEYTKIFTANLVLNSLDKVAGGTQEKANLKAEAHLLRAYAMFVLANNFCLPYTESNKTEPGLVLKQTTSFEEPVGRATLQETYAFIENDVLEALKSTSSLIVNGKVRHWRGSKTAAAGFAARYYLQINNYTAALKYANLALADYNILVDYNTEMKYGNDGVVTVNGTPFTIKYPYTHNSSNDFDIIGWKEFLYLRTLNFSGWWFMPSQDLMNQYDQVNDLRYEYHFVEGYSYDRGLNANPSYSYPGYIFFYKSKVPSGPTTAEMYLIKAECLVRENNTGDALTAVNMLRAKRMKPGLWVNLTAEDQAEALAKILQERRRELPFSHRWLDIRRLNHNGDNSDDVVISKTFYPYTTTVNTSAAPVTYVLPNNSRRYAQPIPAMELPASKGVIKQNTY